MYDEIKPSKKRVKKNFAALNALIEKEESSMKKHRIKLKLLIAAAAISAASMVTLLVVGNAAPEPTIVKFTMCGEEIEGEYRDYVDSKGFRQISFSAVMPMDDRNFAIIFDVDAPRGENVRVITNDMDPDFIENLYLFKEAEEKAWETAEKTITVTEDGVRIEESDNYPETDPEDFGLFFKDSEICIVRLSYIDEETGNLVSHDLSIGGNFMHMGAADDKPSGCGGKDHPNICHYDLENRIMTWKNTLHYYVGKDFKIPEAAENTSESGECQTAETADNR